MKDIREHQARPKGNLSKRIIAAIAMLGGVGYATATTAVAEDTSVTQTQTTEPQTEKTTDAGSNAATEGSSTDTGATAEGSSANSNAATEGSPTDTNAAVEGNDAENTDAEEEDPQADDTETTPVVEGDASTEKGSQLLSETFKNNTFAEPENWETKGSACLTAATDSSKCKRTQDSKDIQDTNGQGYLQLTDNSQTQSGAVLYTQPVISKNGLHVTFDYYMYHTTSVGDYTNPADGISFFLTDGAATLNQTGAEGAGLGYATSDDDGIGTNSTRGQGIAQGVLGIGLDRFGNFSKQNASGSTDRGAYARVTGGEDCGQWENPQGANSVTVRGKGATDTSGKWTQGYCIVASQNISKKVPNGLDTGTATKSESDANGKTVDITIDPVTDENATKQHLTVKIGTGTDAVTVIDTTIDRLPDSVKFGFSASTGADHQVQLIRGLNVYSVMKLNQLDLVKSVNKDKYPNADTHVFKVGDTVPYTFVVRNSGNTQLNDVKVTDPNITSVTCPATTLTSNQQTVCSGTLTITANMVDENGHFTNTATASATNSSGETVNSPQASATIKAIKPLGAPEKHKRIKKNNNSTYTVNVDVKGAQAGSTIVTSEPVDFTLVLDTSKSMEDRIGSVTKLQALKDAVDNFLNSAAEINNQSSSLVKVALISFNGNASVESDFTDDFTSMKDTVNGLSTLMGTRSDYGLQKVSTVTGSRDNAKQVVIFFTDGEPQASSGMAFKDPVAADAVSAAKELKDSGKTIYSIGVVNGADPSDTTENINKFLNAVSNNYPKATAEYTNWSTTFNLGEGGNKGYYKAATDAEGLNKIFEEIQKEETTTYGFTNVSIEDTLSGYVELSDKKYTVTAKDANGNEVALEDDTDYTLTYDGSAKKFTVVFLNTLGDGVTYTLAYNVKPTQKAYDEYVANGYGDTIGDEGTDLDGNTTSSGQPGFHSNESACLAYTANNVAHACSDNPYPHPVIQVVSSTLHIEKQWKGNGNKPESVTVDVKRGDDVYKTVTLKADDDGNWTADVVIPAGEEKAYTVTETSLSRLWHATYQHRLADEDLSDGNEVTVPESTESQEATVVITNSYVSVATLPFTGSTTERQWLLTAGVIAALSMLMIGAAGIWRGKKRLV